MMGVSPPPSQGWGSAPPPHHPQDRTADGVLDTPRSVCLLRSRRRTFLSYYVITTPFSYQWITCSDIQVFYWGEISYGLLPIAEGYVLTGVCLLTGGRGVPQGTYPPPRAKVPPPWPRYLQPLPPPPGQDSIWSTW